MIEALVLHLVTPHFKDESSNGDKYVTVTPGIGVKLDNGIVGGVYRNSFKNPSIYLGYQHEWDNWGLMGGIATGYRKNGKWVECNPQPCADGRAYREIRGDTKLTFMIAPSYKYGALRVSSPNLAGIHFSLEYKLP